MSQPQETLVIHHASELENLPRRKYLIKGFLDEGSMSVVFGASNSGKTFIAIDIACHIALDWTWCDQKTKGGSVVYIAAEGGLGIHERLTALRKHYSIEEYPDIRVIPSNVSLCGDNNDTTRLLNTINNIPNLKLVIVDTLARAISGGNENSPEDMGAFIKNCDIIRAATQAHVMIVHHSGKDAERGGRGHSSLKAAVDTEVEVKQGHDGIITAKVTKQRDGKTGNAFSFQLQEHHVSDDEDGDPVVSCALSKSEAAPHRKKLTGQSARAHRILVNCLIDKGEERHVRRDMPRVKCLILKEFKAALEHENITTSDKPDTVNKAIIRAIDKLNNEGITNSYGDYIWLTDKADK